MNFNIYIIDKLQGKKIKIFPVLSVKLKNPGQYSEKRQKQMDVKTCQEILTQTFRWYLSACWNSLLYHLGIQNMKQFVILLTSPW